MSRLGEREELLPEEKAYSVVKMDTWKPPSHDEFAFKVGEIDSLDERPITVAGRGEWVVVLDADGNPVSVADDSDDQTTDTARETADETAGERSGGR